MFIRRTRTRSSGEHYLTFRLVRSERIGAKVRQRTLLNLGRHFDVARIDWPVLCRRIDDILAGQFPLSGGPSRQGPLLLGHTRCLGRLLRKPRIEESQPRAAHRPRQPDLERNTWFCYSER